MIKNTSIRYLIVLITTAFMVWSVVNIVSIVSTFTKPPVNRKDLEQGVKLKAFELVDQALKTKTRAFTFTFKGAFKPPFRLVSGVKRKRAGGKAKPRQVHKKLFLKGTLIKDNALAIIVDEDGKTFICKQGDRVHNRLVGEIEEDRVTIRDKRGNTVLKVRDR